MAMRRKSPERLTKAVIRANLEGMRLLYGTKSSGEYPDKGSGEKTPPRSGKQPSRVPRGTKANGCLPEWREQAALVQWCQLQPALRMHVINIRNEGRRNPAQANVARMMGLRKGASDLFIARPAFGCHGLWLEVKEAREYTASEMRTPTWLAQLEFICLMRDTGYGADFAFGCEDGIAKVRAYLSGGM